MTKTEAIAALGNGNRITHRYFTTEEWVMRTPEAMYLREDGSICTPSMFWKHRCDERWDDGWSIWEEIKVQQKV